MYYLSVCVCTVFDKIYIYIRLRKKSDIGTYQLTANALYKWIGNDTGLLVGENEISLPSLN